MPPQVEVVPHLKEGTAKLISHVFTAHHGGEGEVPLIELVRLFGAELPPAMAAEVQRRGDIHFKPQSAAGGAFLNWGTEVRLREHVGPLPVTVVVPPSVHGHYETTEHRLRLSFAKDGTISAHAKLFIITVSRKLDAITASHDEVVIDVEGGEFSRHFRFA